MRTLMMIALSMFAAACAVDAPDQLDRANEDIPMIHVEKPDEQIPLDEVIPCKSTLDCRGLGQRLACDVVTSTCVAIVLEDFEEEQ